jgi:hypothetical protein
VFAADMPDGRWYMGFTPCEKGVQVCCPKKGVLLGNDLKCDYGSIWDPEHSRVVFITSDDSPIVGFPQTVTVWDYTQGTLTTYKPWQPPASDFR